MAGESKTTTDHEEIKNWVEKRGGKPAIVKGTDDQGEGVLRIDFQDGDGKEDRLEEVSWDKFFEVFDNNKLQFLYQEELASGEESRFFKFVRQ